MSNIDKYETRKKMVYDFMCDDMYVPMKIKELCIVLGVKKEDRPQLERYNEVTTQIISEDIDSVGELLDERQQIIAAMDGISLDIKQFVNDQSIERRDKINALLNSATLSYSGYIFFFCPI